MALTDFITTSWIDYKGKVGTMKVFFPEGFTDAELLALNSSLVNALDNVTGCLYTGATVTKRLGVTAPSLKTEAVDDVDTERGMNMGFQPEDTPYRHTIRIIGADPTLDDGEHIEFPSSEYTAVIALVEDGVDPIFPSDRMGNDLHTFLDDLVTFHKS